MVWSRFIATLPISSFLLFHPLPGEKKRETYKICTIGCDYTVRKGPDLPLILCTLSFDSCPTGVSWKRIGIRGQWLLSTNAGFLIASHIGLHKHRKRKGGVWRWRPHSRGRMIFRGYADMKRGARGTEHSRKSSEIPEVTFMFVMRF